MQGKRRTGGVAQSLRAAAYQDFSSHNAIHVEGGLWADMHAKHDFGSVTLTNAKQRLAHATQ